MTCIVPRDYLKSPEESLVIELVQLAGMLQVERITLIMPGVTHYCLREYTLFHGHLQRREMTLDESVMFTCRVDETCLRISDIFEHRMHMQNLGLAVIIRIPCRDVYVIMCLHEDIKHSIDKEQVLHIVPYIHLFYIYESVRLTPYGSMDRGDFIAHISQEIKTPLMHIISNTKRLEEQLMGNSVLADLKAANMKLMSFTSNLMDISSLLHGIIQLHPVETMLHDLINDTIKISNINHDLELDIHPILLHQPLLVDRKRLMQVLINLLRQADDPVGISAVLDKHKRVLYVSIRGGDKPKSKMILDLVIADHIIRYMGGCLHIMTHLGHGTVWSFSILLRDTPLEIIRDKMIVTCGVSQCFLDQLRGLEARVVAFSNLNDLRYSDADLHADLCILSEDIEELPNDWSIKLIRLGWDITPRPAIAILQHIVAQTIASPPPHKWQFFVYVEPTCSDIQIINSMLHDMGITPVEQASDATAHIVDEGSQIAVLSVRRHVIRKPFGITHLMEGIQFITDEQTTT